MGSLFHVLLKEYASDAVKYVRSDQIVVISQAKKKKTLASFTPTHSTDFNSRKDYGRVKTESDGVKNLYRVMIIAMAESKEELVKLKDEGKLRIPATPKSKQGLAKEPYSSYQLVKEKDDATKAKAEQSKLRKTGKVLSQVQLLAKFQNLEKKKGDNVGKAGTSTEPQPKHDTTESGSRNFNEKLSESIIDNDMGSSISKDQPNDVTIKKVGSFSNIGSSISKHQPEDVTTDKEKVNVSMSCSTSKHQQNTILLSEDNSIKIGQKFNVFVDQTWQDLGSPQPSTSKEAEEHGPCCPCVVEIKERLCRIEDLLTERYQAGTIPANRIESLPHNNDEASNGYVDLGAGLFMASTKMEKLVGENEPLQTKVSVILYSMFSKKTLSNYYLHCGTKEKEKNPNAKKFPEECLYNIEKAMNEANKAITRKEVLKKHAKKLEHLTDPVDIKQTLDTVDQIAKAQAKDLSGKAFRRAVSHILSLSRGDDKKTETKKPEPTGLKTDVDRRRNRSNSSEDEDGRSPKRLAIDRDLEDANFKETLSAGDNAGNSDFEISQQ